MHSLDQLFKDIRFAVRQMKRSPALTIAVTVCLALGIGANTAIFAAIDAVMLQMLPVKDPSSLVMLTWSASSRPGHFVSDMLGGGPVSENGPSKGIRTFSYATFETLHGGAASFSTTFAVAGNDQQVNAEANGAAYSATMQGVSGNYFDALAVPAALGRTLVPSDDQPSQPPVAVISQRFWQDKFGGSPSIVGRTLTVNGDPMTIVGVAPPEFFGLAPGTSPDFWVPLSVYMGQKAFVPAGRSQVGSGPPTPIPYWKAPTTWWLEIFGRLKPEVQEAQAQTELQGLFDATLRGSAGPEAAQAPTPRIDLSSIKYGLAGLRQQYSTSLFLLMGVVALVLMIACGNVAALLLARATARQREIAVRVSLGASRWRLIRQLLTESILLAIIGGILGLLFAIWADSLLVKLLAGERSRLSIDLHLNGTVLAFTTGTSAVTGILFGLIPALRATRLDLVRAVKQSGPFAIINDSRFRSGRLVVAGQIALCFVLVMSAGLCLRTLQNLHRIDAGFDSRQLLLFTVRPGLNGYKDEKLIQYYDNLKQRIEILPGVRSVSLSTRGPVGQGVGNSGVIIPGYTPAGEDTGINRHQVGPDYFQTLGIPIIRGRGIGKQDGQNAHKVVVVNERLVREFFHGDNPIGRSVFRGSTTSGTEYEIVGIAKDVKYNRMQDEIPPTIYYPYLQFLSVPNAMTFEVRGDAQALANVSSLITPIQREASLLDSTVPLTAITTETQVIEDTFALERALASLGAVFGLLALLLVGVGLYGTIAYTVTRQTKEIGIRMALGAQRQAIFVTVLRWVSTVFAIGIAAGVILAFSVTPLLRTWLYGLTAHDGTTVAAAALIIGAVVLVAGYLPARRASKVDPMTALRYE